MPPPGSRCGAGRRGLLGENENAAAAVDVDQRVVDQVGVAREEVLLGDDDVEVERGLAEGVHQVGDGQRRDVPVAGVLELGDPQRAPLGDVLALKSWTSRTVSLSAGISRPVA